MNRDPNHTRTAPQDMSVEKLIALGFTTTLREYDALCDLRDQYAEMPHPTNEPAPMLAEEVEAAMLSA